MSADHVGPDTQKDLEALLTEFARLIDNGMADQVHQLFTEDGRITGPGLALQSQADIAKQFGERAKYKRRVSRHLWSNPHFERIDDTRIRVSTVVQTFVHSLADDEQLPAPADSFVVGDSIDVMQLCSDNRWRFQSRELKVVFRK